MTNPIPTPRAAANRANSLHSTGPRTAPGKQRSSLNALTHGLTASSPVLPTEDPAAYQLHCRRLFDEYQPATPAETQLVQELAGTAWRLNRIPALEADLLSQDLSPAGSTLEDNRMSCTGEQRLEDSRTGGQTLVPLLATLGLHGSRLSRQFQKTLAALREIQAGRRLREERDLARAAALLELHKRKGLPFEPAHHGFVFSKHQIEAHAHRLILRNESRHLEHVLFHMPPPSERDFSTPSADYLNENGPRRR